MPFTQKEKESLIAHGVWPDFIAYLETENIHTPSQLAQKSVTQLLGTNTTNARCRKDALQARKSAEEAILWAIDYLAHPNVKTEE